MTDMTDALRVLIDDAVVLDLCVVPAAARRQDRLGGQPCGPDRLQEFLALPGLDVLLQHVDVAEEILRICRRLRHAAVVDVDRRVVDLQDLVVEPPFEPAEPSTTWT